MHMTENSYMPQSARMRAQIQANTVNFAGQRFSLHGVDLTKIDGGGARKQEVFTSAPLRVCVPAIRARYRSGAPPARGRALPRPALVSPTHEETEGGPAESNYGQQEED